MTARNQRMSDYCQGQLMLYPSPTKQASFNALLRSKNKSICQSSRCEPNPAKSPMLYSQFSNRSTNKQNISDQYQLFTNMIKSKKFQNSQSESNRGEQSNMTNMRRKNKYFLAHLDQGEETEGLKTQDKKRSSSKQSIEKYFEGSKCLIKKRSRQQEEVRVEEVLQSVCTESEAVNRSEDSIDFDMSPFLS